MVRGLRDGAVLPLPPRASPTNRAVYERAPSAQLSGRSIPQLAQLSTRSIHSKSATRRTEDDH